MSDPLPRCEECGSPFLPAASAMAGLCAECAHALYGYPPCSHAFEHGACKRCGWNGASSAFIAGRRTTPRPKT